jgi:hypothetical protein
MKLIIKTRDIEIEYQDEYAMLEGQAKDRIIELIETIYSSQPANTIPNPLQPVGTAEEFFKTIKK